MALAACTPANSAGASFNGDLYERIRVLGRGSFGTAVVHRRRADCALVVLKEIELARLQAPGRQAALQEARIMAGLEHENIIRYYNAYAIGTKLVIEMEYARMGTLQAFLALQAASGGAGGNNLEQQLLDELQALGIFRQLASGLAYLHARRIVHLDLKTANVFVSAEGVAKLGDFGIAQFLAPDQPSRLNGNNNELQRKQLALGQQHLGTLAYSSPERCLGLSAPNSRALCQADVWSMGCILYELLTLRLLFPSESLAELVLSITQVRHQPLERADISLATRRLFERTIAREPARRPSAQELLELVDGALGQLEGGAGGGQRARAIANARGGARNAIAAAATAGHVKQLVAGNEKRRFRRALEVFSSEQQTNLQPAGLLNATAAASQINYPHSLIYQVRLDGAHVEVARVNLPQSKRIKQICKGRAHYLALTYDHIVYGWGARHCGQLGACKLSLASAHQPPGGGGGELGVSAAASRRTNSFTARKCARSGGRERDSPQQAAYAASLTQPPSLASSTQTLGARNLPALAGSALDLAGLMREARPARKPFVLGELNKRKIERLAAGDDFSVFLSKTGILMTCGDGSTGCLGRGELASSHAPCMVDSLLNMDVVGVACGPAHVAAVCGNGRAFAWGALADGRLGLGAPNELDGRARQALRRDRKYVALPQQVSFSEQVMTGTLEKSGGGGGSSALGGLEAGEQPFIVSAFCGDKCTIFIDSQHKCWACGENKHNKLGLDVRRRFRRTLVVASAWRATRVAALDKFHVLACNIGANHATFLTLEGKLIVLGQDLDHSYALGQNLAHNCESFRQIAADLRPPPPPSARLRKSWRRKQAGGVSAPAPGGQQADQEQFARTLLANNQLASFKSCEPAAAGGACKQPSLKATRFQRRQVDAYLRRSRALRRAPFEQVLSAACTAKFTLALTNDNRVYFWGARSYLREAEEAARNEHEHEDLVVADDEASFVKIGATNSTLMNNIELLGSDQPILQARDPQLSANSLADLWILDYRPAHSCRNSVEQSSAAPGARWPECAACSRKHDAILEPQPIVSLYVPSMFNHHGAALKLVNLFCHDDERFFLVLDTTVKQQQAQPQQQLQPLVNRSNSSRRASAALVQFNARGQQQRADQAAAPLGQLLPAGHWQSSSQRLNMVEEWQSGASAGELGARGASRRPSELEGLRTQSGNSNEASCDCDVGAPPTESPNELAFHAQAPLSIGGGARASPSSDTNQLLCAPQMSPTSHNGGLSLEEPRSMSTFAAHLGACAPSNILLGPSLNLHHQASASNMIHESSVADQNAAVAAGEGPLGEARRLQRRRQRARLGRRRHRSLVNLSESTAVTCDETSTMPTWVRNEYFQQQPSSSAALDQLNDATEDDETACSLDSSTLDHHLEHAAEQSRSSAQSASSRSFSESSRSNSSTRTVAAVRDDDELSARVGAGSQLEQLAGRAKLASSTESLRSLAGAQMARQRRRRQVSCSQPNLTTQASGQVDELKGGGGGGGGSSSKLDEGGGAARWTGANIGNCRVYQTLSGAGERRNNTSALKFSSDSPPPPPEERRRLRAEAAACQLLQVKRIRGDSDEVPPPPPPPPLSSSCVEVTMVEMGAPGGGSRDDDDGRTSAPRRLSQSQTHFGQAKMGAHNSRASLSSMRKSLLRLFC